MKDAFVRKLFSAYAASACIILYLSLNTLINEAINPYSGDHFFGWAFVYAMYVIPVMFVYGITVSLLTDYLLKKCGITGIANLIVSALLHTAMGSAFGLMIPMFGVIGGTSAALFFAADRLLWLKKGGLSKAYKINVLIAPLCVIGVTGGYLFAVSPPVPPFTEKDAVQFATGGSGSVTDLFPDEVGTLNTVVDGYQVERETAVRQVAKEKYEVSFIERWSNEGKSGENRMNYIITRGTLSANGGGGDKLPYRR